MHQRVRKMIVSPRNLIFISLIVGIVGLATLFYHSSPYVKVLPPLVGIGALFAAFLHRRELRTRRLALSAESLFSLYMVVVALTFVTFSLSNYRRALPVHVLLLFLYLISLVSVFSEASQVTSLPLIVATAIIHRGLTYYSSAVQLGIDALFHNRMAGEIAVHGSLSPLAEASSKYWYAPLYHVMTGISSQLLHVSTRDAAFVVVVVAAVLVPVLFIYNVLDHLWNTQIGLVGSYLYLTSDSAVASSVHVGTTTLGIVFFTLAVLLTIRYLETGRYAYLGGFLLIFVSQLFSHQLSTTITVAGVVTYVLIHSFWTGRLGRRETTLLAPLLIGQLYQWSVTKYQGPGGEDTFFDVVTSSLGQQLFSNSGTVAPPNLESATLSGTGSLSFVHFLGVGLLICFTVLGTIYWVSRRQGQAQRIGVCLSFVGVSMSCLVFGGGILGVDSLALNRWTPSIYIILAILAAPGVGVLLSTAASSVEGKRKHLALLAVILLLAAPYTVLMTWNYPGALDGAPFDDSPGAQRLSSTPTEVALYSHVDNYGGESLVVGDRLADRVLQRHYGYPSTTFTAQYGSEESTIRNGDLVVYRDYATTQHASYYLKYRTKAFVVYSPLPVDWNEHSVVYAAGSDRLVYYNDPSADGTSA